MTARPKARRDRPRRLRAPAQVGAIGLLPRGGFGQPNDMTSIPSPRLDVVAESVADWVGQDVLDPDGEKVGKLADVLYDAETDVPAFVSVKSGLVGKHLSLVPLDGATVGPQHLRVQYRKADVKDAPNYEIGTELSIEDEAEAYKFFGLQYTTAGDGARRLAKR
jgi:hypothetical protein